MARSVIAGKPLAVGKTEFPTARPFLPARVTLPQLRAAAALCRGCDLYKRATQTVFGEGPRSAALMLVGEAPGDQEDRQGHPFVGPAGALLDKAIVEAGIDRGTAYLTNVVKHFKWTPSPRGKRRIHQKPSAGQIRACVPWLENELAIVTPKVLVCLGATAAQALLGATFRVSMSRGIPVRDTRWAPCVIATAHPSAVLRAPDAAARRRDFAALVADLKVAAGELAATGA